MGAGAVYALVLTALCLSVHASTWLQQPYSSFEKGAHPPKTLTLLEGTFPRGSAVTEATSGRVLIRDAEDVVEEHPFSGSLVPFEPAYKGSYHVVAEYRHIEGETLHVTLAKLRTYNRHGDMKEALLNEVRGKTVGTHYGKEPFARLPFEVVQYKPLKQHHINCCIYSGDMARFRIFYKGKPQTGIALDVVTQKGWRNRIEAGEDGMIAFEVPRTTYADIHTDKRHSERMLVEASYTVDEPGTFEGIPYRKVRYTMSQPLRFYASPLEYASQLPGFLTAIGVMLAFGLGAYYHRRRKRKAPREIWFDEDA